MGTVAALTKGELWDEIPGFNRPLGEGRVRPGSFWSNGPIIPHCFPCHRAKRGGKAGPRRQSVFAGPISPPESAAKILKVVTATALSLSTRKQIFRARMRWWIAMTDSSGDSVLTIKPISISTRRNELLVVVRVKRWLGSSAIVPRPSEKSSHPPPPTRLRAASCDCSRKGGDSTTKSRPAGVRARLLSPQHERGCSPPSRRLCLSLGVGTPPTPPVFVK